MLGWIRPKDTPLPEEYRVNFIIRDPALIALLVRGAPHGKITSTVLRLVQEGYNHLVASKEINPADFLTPQEMDLLRIGKKASAKRVARDAAATAPPASAAAAPAAPPVAARSTAHPETPKAVAPVPASSVATLPPAGPGTAPLPLDDVPSIDDASASVLLGARG